MISSTKTTLIEISLFDISFDDLSNSNINWIAVQVQLLIFQLQIQNKYGIIA
jgi:hypothetical protein